MTFMALLDSKLVLISNMANKNMMLSGKRLAMAGAIASNPTKGSILILGQVSQSESLLVVRLFLHCWVEL